MHLGPFNLNSTQNVLRKKAGVIIEGCKRLAYLSGSRINPNIKPNLKQPKLN